jgi:carbohydrate kinase (thermoresistant glucokinase family)
MGVSGAGKTTIARALAARLGWDFADGDGFHPQANIDKMAAGQPLTDDDRWPWLRSVADWIRDHTDAGRDAVIACSALKRSYRDVLRGPGVVFVLLAGDRDTIAERLRARHGHFMPIALLDSQLATLEPPASDECAITVDVAASPSEIVDEILAQLGSLAEPMT